MPFDAAMLLNAAIPHDLSVRAAILIAALGLDALVGDPPWLWVRVPHPVVLFGRAVTGMDRLFNQRRLVGIRLKGKSKRGLGALAIIMLVGLAVATGGLAATTASAGGMLLSATVELLLVTFLLAGRSLADHVKAVGEALENGSIEDARIAVSKIVGRNPDALDRPAVARAAIETTAENLSDGVIAPALFYFTFGIPGIFAYKMVNTADSMVGYRAKTYFSFGWGAARLDDLANIIPARLTGLLIALSGPRRTVHAIAVMFRDAPHHRSPNAGWPEAAMATQLGLSLAGPRSYGHRKSRDREMNKGGNRSVDHTDLVLSLALMWRTIGLFALMVATIAWIWSGG